MDSIFVYESLMVQNLDLKSVAFELHKTPSLSINTPVAPSPSLASINETL